MPGLQKTPLVVDAQSFDIPQLFGAKAQVAGQGHRFDPELARLIVPIDVHVRRLVGFVTVKI
jgi:hypothetical protein